MKKIVTMIVANIAIFVLCTVFVVNITPQADETVTVELKDGIVELTAEEWRKLNASGIDLAAIQTIAQLQAILAAPAVEELPPLVAGVPVCSFTQDQLDDLLTKLNELYNNIFTMAQIIQNAPQKSPNTDLEALMLNSNMPQNVSRTCQAMLDRIDYLNRICIVMVSHILYAIPPSAERNALEKTLV